MGIPIEERYGGAGGDTVSYAIAIEELTRIDSSVAITVAAHTSLGTMPIYLFGSDEQKERWLPDLASGRRLAAFGLTEPDAGSDAGATRTTAELRDGAWVVNGSKMFITNAGTDLTWGVTLTARTGEDEVSNIVVENGTPGYDDLGAAAQARLEGLRHARADLLGLRGAGGQPPRAARQGLPPVPRDPRRRPDLRRGDGRRPRPGRLRPRVRVREGADTVRQADRELPGGRRSSSRTWRSRSRPAASSSTGPHGSRTRAAPFALEAAMAKLYTGELSHRVVNHALQIHGGYGFMDEFADLAPLPRPEDPRDRRGHERGAADGHREAPRALTSRSRLQQAPGAVQSVSRWISSSAPSLPSIPPDPERNSSALGMPTQLSSQMRTRPALRTAHVLLGGRCDVPRPADRAAGRGRPRDRLPLVRRGRRAHDSRVRDPERACAARDHVARARGARWCGDRGRRSAARVERGGRGRHRAVDGRSHRGRWASRPSHSS